MCTHPEHSAGFVQTTAGLRFLGDTPRCILPPGAALSQESAAQKGLPVPRMSVGVWSGPLICGNFGYEGLKHAGGLGLGYGVVAELQQYAAAMRYPVLASWRTYDLLRIAPAVRLLAIDVLDYSANGRHPTSGAHPGELVFEVWLDLPCPEPWPREGVHTHVQTHARSPAPQSRGGCSRGEGTDAGTRTCGTPVATSLDNDTDPALRVHTDHQCQPSKNQPPSDFSQRLDC